MPKALSLMLALLLMLSLFAGCSDAESEETTEAAKTHVSETTAPTETEAETEPAETEETYPEAQLHTAVLRDSDEALRLDYVVIAVSEDAPFLAQGVSLNTQGADAFVQWLTTEDAREIIGDFGQAEYGEAIFTCEEVTAYTGWIGLGNTYTNTIRLAADETIVETGLLEELLPVFEEGYGYTVEVTEGTARSVLSSARNGNADLVLVVSGDLSQTLVDDGYAQTVSGMDTDGLRLCGLQYLLCGPTDDPAGVAGCASAEKAFAAIAAGEYIFTSRGDGSVVHQLEQSLWAQDVEFGDWYFSADMDMGPCLVFNDMEGGYILTDKLTWLKYDNENGII